MDDLRDYYKNKVPIGADPEQFYLTELVALHAKFDVVCEQFGAMYRAATGHDIPSTTTPIDDVAKVRADMIRYERERVMLDRWMRTNLPAFPRTKNGPVHDVTAVMDTARVFVTSAVSVFRTYLPAITQLMARLGYRWHDGQWQAIPTEGDRDDG